MSLNNLFKQAYEEHFMLYVIEHKIDIIRREIANSCLIKEMNFNKYKQYLKEQYLKEQYLKEQYGKQT